MLNPRTPKSQCFSARVTKRDVRGLIFSSIGANAFQVTLTLNFGGEGVVPDRRDLNISSIYGRNQNIPEPKLDALCGSSLWFPSMPTAAKWTSALALSLLSASTQHLEKESSCPHTDMKEYWLQTSCIWNCIHENSRYYAELNPTSIPSGPRTFSADTTRTRTAAMTPSTGLSHSSAFCRAGKWGNICISAFNSFWLCLVAESVKARGLLFQSNQSAGIVGA